MHRFTREKAYVFKFSPANNTRECPTHSRRLWTPQSSVISAEREGRCAGVALGSAGAAGVAADDESAVQDRLCGSILRVSSLVSVPWLVGSETRFSLVVLIVRDWRPIQLFGELLCNDCSRTPFQVLLVDDPCTPLCTYLLFLFYLKQ